MISQKSRLKYLIGFSILLFVEVSSANPDPSAAGGPTLLDLLARFAHVPPADVTEFVSKNEKLLDISFGEKLLNASESLVMQGKKVDALGAALLSREIARQVSANELETEATYQCSRILLQLQRYDDAARFASEAASRYREGGNKLYEIDAIQNLAAASLHQRRSDPTAVALEELLSALKRALELAKTIERPDLEIGIRLNLATLRQEMNDIKGAIYDWKAAFLLAESSPEVQLAPIWVIATVKYSQAIRSFPAPQIEESLESSLKPVELSNYASFLPQLERARQTAFQLGDSYLITLVLDELSGCSETQGNLVEALLYIDQADEYLREMQPTIYESKSDSGANRNYTFSPRENHFNLLIRGAMLSEKLGLLAEAESYLERAQTIASESKSVESELLALAQQVKICDQTGNSAGYFESLDEATKILESNYYETPPEHRIFDELNTLRATVESSGTPEELLGHARALRRPNTMAIGRLALQKLLSQTDSPVSSKIAALELQLLYQYDLGDFPSALSLVSDLTKLIRANPQVIQAIATSISKSDPGLLESDLQTTLAIMATSYSTQLALLNSMRDEISNRTIETMLGFRVKYLMNGKMEQISFSNQQIDAYVGYLSKHGHELDDPLRILHFFVIQEAISLLGNSPSTALYSLFCEIETIRLEYLLGKDDQDIRARWERCASEIIKNLLMVETTNSEWIDSGVASAIDLGLKLDFKSGPLGTLLQIANRTAARETSAAANRDMPFDKLLPKLEQLKGHEESGDHRRTVKLIDEAIVYYESHKSDPAHERDLYRSMIAKSMALLQSRELEEALAFSLSIRGQLSKTNFLDFRL